MSKRYVLNASIEFSPQENQLSAYQTDNLAINLNAPVSRCLELLIERRYSLVPQQEFYAYVWGDQGAQVPVSTLYQNIALLRKALKAFKDAGEKIVNTVPKQGFSLHADVTVLEIEGASMEVTLAHSPTITTEIASTETPLDEKTEPLTALPAPKRVHTVRIRSQLLFVTGIIFLLGLMILQLVLWGYPSYENYLSKYTKKGTVAECHIYANHEAADMAIITRSLEDSQIDCTKRAYIYITSFEYGTNTSLLSCDRPLDAATSPECFAFYSIEDR